MKQGRDKIFFKRKGSIEFPYYQVIQIILQYLSKNNKLGKARKITCKLLDDRKSELKQPIYRPLTSPDFSRRLRPAYRHMKVVRLSTEGQDRLWGHSMLLCEYWGPFPWVRNLGVKLTTYFPLLPRLKISAVIFPQMAWWWLKGSDVTITLVSALKFIDRRKG